MTALRRAGHAVPPAMVPELDRAAFIRPIAHRGLHGALTGLVENTAPAFSAAIDRGYGIECDLQAAEDGTPMVFHDEVLERLVEASGRIAAHTPAALSKLRYKGRDERILTFAQFLDLVGGRVPLLVEVKTNRRGAAQGSFLDKIAQLAKDYRGPLALMSFDVRVVRDLGARTPKVPRGSIVGSRQALATLWRSAASKPRASYASVNVSYYAVDIRLAATARRWLTRQELDLPLFAWTVRTPRQRMTAARWADAPIFEGYAA